jgi:hypothetical protein
VSIFFLRSAFEPKFIFELTPAFIFKGFNNLQLLFLSLVVVAYDAFLHIKGGRKNLIYSFIPTFIMLGGIGVGISTKELSISNFPYYILFGLLLLVVVVDHKHTLKVPEVSKEPTLPHEPVREEVLRFGKPKIISPIPAMSFLFSIFKGKSSDMSSKRRDPVSSIVDKGVSSRSDKPSLNGFTSEIEPKEKKDASSPGFDKKVEEKIANLFEVFDDEPKEEGRQVEDKTSLYDRYKGPRVSPPLSDERKVDFLNGLKKELRKTPSVSRDDLGFRGKDGLVADMEKHKEKVKDLQEKLASFSRGVRTFDVQEIQSNFNNVQRGLETLINEIENIYRELRVQESRKPVTLWRESERLGRETFPDIAETPGGRMIESFHGAWFLKQELEEKRRKYELWRAQNILKDLEKKVEKLEQVYIK